MRQDGVYGAYMPMNAEERLIRIAELIPGPCPPPDIAGGFDMCPCGSGQAWPCTSTQAAWLATGVDEAAQVRKACKAAELEMAIEQEYWEELNERDPEAARQYAMRQLGW